MTIQQIDPLTPTGADPVSEGDNQFNALKSDIVNSLPGFAVLPAATAAVDVTNVTGTQLEQIHDAEITEIWTFTARVQLNSGLNLENAAPISAEQVDTTPLTILRMSTINQVEVGNSAVPTNIRGSEAFVTPAFTCLSDMTVTGQVIASADIDTQTITCHSTFDLSGNLDHSGTGACVYTGTPVPRATTAITGATYLAGGGIDVSDGGEFGGYTVGQVVAALKLIGILT